MTIPIKKFESDAVIVNYSKKNNIFDFISLNELGTSQLIAWLLDPEESHGLGNAFLKAFVAEINNSIKQHEELNSDRLTLGDIGSATILTEQTIKHYGKKGRLDILLVSDKVCIVIENKFGSKEHNNQLSFYQKYFSNTRKNKLEKTFFVYLDVNMNVPEMEHIAQKGWIPLDFSWISEFIVNHKKDVKEQRIRYILESFHTAIDDESAFDDCMDQLCHTHAELINAVKDLHEDSITDFIADKKHFDISLYKTYVKHQWIFERLIKRMKYIKEIDLSLAVSKKFKTSYYIQKGSCDFTTWKIAERSEENDTYWPIYINISLNDDDTCSIKLYLYISDMRQDESMLTTLESAAGKIKNKADFSFTERNTYCLMSSTDVSQKQLLNAFGEQWDALLKIQKIITH